MTHLLRSGKIFFASLFSVLKFSCAIIREHGIIAKERERERDTNSLKNYLKYSKVRDANISEVAITLPCNVSIIIICRRIVSLVFPRERERERHAKKKQIAQERTARSRERTNLANKPTGLKDL